MCLKFSYFYIISDHFICACIYVGVLLCMLMLIAVFLERASCAQNTELFPRQLLHVASPNNLLVREEDGGILVIRVGVQQHCLCFKTNFPVSYFLLISPEH